MLYCVTTLTKDGKYQSFAHKVPYCNNLVGYCTSKKGLASVHSFDIFKTWKEAQKIANFWNDCYKNNGTYFLDCYH
jgi:hypothetical protein